MNFSEKDLVPVAPRVAAGTSVQAKTGWAAELAPSVQAQFELRLLGMRMEEALEALRQQVDAAVLSGLREFAVIHGKGDGILQKGVHDYLRNEKAVADYYFARPELGGFGRTEVILK
jgi:DNA mismatch repair protein MutS2